MVQEPLLRKEGIEANLPGMSLTATANRHRIFATYDGMHMSSLDKEYAEIWTPVIIKTFLCELMFDSINT